MAKAWFIIKDDGLASGDTGRVEVKPTGSYATLGTSNYYPTAVAAFAASTPPVGGDDLIFSDVHDHTYTTATYDGGSTSIPVNLVSVSDSNMDQESFGAIETMGSSQDLTITGTALHLKSMKLSIGDDIAMNTANSTLYATDCEITFQGSLDRFLIGGDGIAVVLVDTDIIYTAGTTGGVFRANNGTRISMLGGSIKSTSGNVDAVVQADSFISAGAVGDFTGVDLSNVNGDWISGGGGGAADDLIKFVFRNCDKNASVEFNDETPISPAHSIEAYGCSSTSDGAEYQFYRSLVWGDIEDQDDSGIHRDETQAFDSGTKVSMKITTTANCTVNNPFIFKLPSRFAALSAGSTDTMRVYFASTTALTDQNFWLQAYVPDGTNKNHDNTFTTRNGDIFATGNAHTADTGSTWKDGVSDLAGHNEYREDISTAGDVAADGVPRLYYAIAEPSATIYIDVIFDLVA